MEEQSKKNVWKPIAIVFIILTVLLILVIAWIFSVGEKVIDLENECSYNVCEDYNSFYLDYYSNLCYCFDGEGEIVVEKYIS